MFHVQTHLCTTLRSQKISKMIWNMRFRDSRLSNIQFFSKLIYHFDLIISWIPDIIQKFYCTPDGVLDPTFQILYIPSRLVFNLMEILIIKQIPFFKAPCIRANEVSNGLSKFSPSQFICTLSIKINKNTTKINIKKQFGCVSKYLSPQLCLKMI